jgi:hypothetical protein
MILLESFSDDIDNFLGHLIGDGFVIQKSDDFVRVFKPISGESYTYSNLKPFDLSEISDDVFRYIESIDNNLYSIDYVYLINRKSGETTREFINYPYNLNSREISAIVIGVK